MATAAEIFELAVQAHQGGDLQRADQLYRQVLDADVAHDGALHLLGVLAYQTKQPLAAIRLLKQAVALRATVANYHYHLGVVYKDVSRLGEALACFEQAVRLDPKHAAAHGNRGMILVRQGLFAEAEPCLRESLQQNPQQAAVACNLGIALEGQGRDADAMRFYEEAFRLDPTHVPTHINLGLAHFALGNLDEAADCFRQALTIDPNHAEAHNNLGLVRKLQGQLGEAVQCHRQALALKPDFVAAHSDLLYALHFDPRQTPASIFAEHERWNRLHAVPLAKFKLLHDNDKNPDRRLRIGYVSADFREHPVGRFMLPLLKAHDHAFFEVFCYASVPLPDAFTEQCRAHADVWRDVHRLSDEELASLIRLDRIDVLVDLALHTGGNRLLAFARKPAPVQVTYLGYCGSTGLKAMDYRLTDPYLDPDDRNERFYSERSIRLPETFWCYQPALDIPLKPRMDEDKITFGCLNNFSKASEPALETWSRVLDKFPEARLLLFVPPGSARTHVVEFFGRRGVSAERLDFVGKTPMVDYLRTYDRIDIALDPFTYGGGTTTCDALWMGVPAVCLAGATAVGRGGVSILSNIGLPDLIAPDIDGYIRIAVDLAADRVRLAKLRAGLRERMEKSPLMNAPRFARQVEAAFRTVWRRWCAV